MYWQKNKPTEPGHYLWRESGHSSSQAHLCNIYDENGLVVDFHLSLDHSNDCYLSEVAEREWLRVPE